MKPESRALLEKSHQSVEAAGVLLEDGFPDFAASRAYYAMFYVAQAFLTEEGLAFSSHSAVISAFGKLFTKTGKVDTRYHRYLLDTQDIRNVGDYGIGPGVSNEQAADCLIWAKEFLETAEQVIA